jgi:hypothetical protein
VAAPPIFFCCAHSILQQKSGKKVFVICRQQVDMPNQPTITILLVINFYGNCKSGLAFSPALRGLSYYLQFLLIPHGSYCVLQPASFNRSSSVPLHHAHCRTVASVPGILPPNTAQIRQDAQSLSQASCTVHLAPFHCFLAISFQQASVHPLPTFILLAGSPT